MANARHLANQRARHLVQWVTNPVKVKNGIEVNKFPTQQKEKPYNYGFSSFVELIPALLKSKLTMV